MMPDARKPTPKLIRATFFLLAALTAGALLHAPGRAEETSASLARSYNRAGLALFAKLAAAPGNFVISPYGIGAAMAMAHAGARGETELQMAQVLDYTLARHMIPAADRHLTAALTQRPAGAGATLKIANALHLTRFGDRVASSYKRLLSSSFGAELFSGSDLAAVNDWVKRKTGGKIDTILSRLDPNSVCVILNAIYFKGAWAAPFDAKSTRPGDFHLSQKETVQVPMMRHNGRYRTLSAPSFDAVALPYEGGALSMIVVLPKNLAAPGQVDFALDGKSAGSLVHDVAAARPENVALNMPKFKTAFAADLIPPFKGLGMTLPFDPASRGFQRHHRKHQGSRPHPHLADPAQDLHRCR